MRTWHLVAVATVALLAVSALRSSPVAVAAPTMCSTRAFRISEAPSQGAGGSFLLDLSYRNVTHSSCVTQGFPGITLLGPGDRKVSVARRDGDGRGALTVRPGARVFSWVEYSETPTGRPCVPVKAVRVYAPGSRQSSVVRVPHGSRACSSRSVVYRMQRSPKSIRGLHSHH